LQDSTATNEFKKFRGRGIGVSPLHMAFAQYQTPACFFRGRPARAKKLLKRNRP